MPILSEIVDHVIGVDTHKHTHTAADLTSTGATIGLVTVPADTTGYRQLVEFADRHPGSRAWSIEGTSDYGAGLARFLAEHDEIVIEAPNTNRVTRRNQPGKTDETDAVWAAQDALNQQHPASPRAGGHRAVLQARLTARRLVVTARTDAQRQLLGLIVTSPQAIKDKLADKTTTQIVKTCARFRVHKSMDPVTAELTQVLRAIAQRVTSLEAEARDHQHAITRLVTAWRPDLLDLYGVGPIVAATVLCAWSHPGRIRSEAAFAMLAGTAPLPASSGQTIRHRLNRTGDRHLNHALHTIVLTRMRADPETRRYVEKRRSQGKTDREIKRCLKRYVARQLFRQLENPPT